MSRTRRTLVLCASSLLLAACESFTSQQTYSMLPDQVFFTRGASEALLGAYGIEDDVGIDSFERIGVLEEVPRPRQLLEMSDTELAANHVYHRTTMFVSINNNSAARVGGRSQIQLVRVAPTIESREDLTRVFSLRIYDLHKRDIVDLINGNDELLDFLRRSDHARVVTAVAVLDTKLTDDLMTETDVKITLEDASGQLGSGSAELSAQTIRNATLSPGTIYAYQMSKVGWSEDGSRVLILKTDRPWVNDRFYIDAYTSRGVRRQ